MSQEITKTDSPNHAQILEKVVTKGDLADLTPADRARHYKAVCDAIGLNWMTKPFEYLELKDKQTGKVKIILYARKECTEQLRLKHKLSARITRSEIIEDVYLAWSETLSQDGRLTEQLGAVSLKGITAEDRANAMKKAVTQSYRRGVLTHCGLGFLDETEVDSIPGAKRIEPSSFEEEDGKDPIKRWA